MAGSGYAELDAMIAKVRRVGVLAETVAKRAAPEVQTTLRASAAAGSAPDGSAWAPKKDGGRPLANAPHAIEVSASGTVITARLVGTATGSQKVQAIQHYGTKRIPARRIIPAAGEGLPKPVEAAVRRVAVKAFEEAVR
jgi:hypothetical protein